MRVLWVCNLIISEFAAEYDVSISHFGGWMGGMLDRLDADAYTIGLCFPVIDDSKRKDGYLEGYYYYSYSADYEESDYDRLGPTIEGEFVRIIGDFEPDVIHIWGTEYIHSYAMLRAAKKCGLIGNTVFHIQGLVSECFKYYTNGVPEEYLHVDNGVKLLDEKKRMQKRGEWEKRCIMEGIHFAGRTDWDKAHVTLLNSKAQYHCCGEILRREFYSDCVWNGERAGEVIFMTQGAYPLKGAHIAIKAIAILKKQYPSIKLEIAGDNLLEHEEWPYARYILELIMSHDLTNNVVYTGKLSCDEIIEKLLHCRCYIMPSSIENSPNSLSEAMMIGAPVIASWVGGIPSIIRNNNEGILFCHDDPYMLALYLKSVIESRELQDKLSKNERIRAREFNNIENTIGQIGTIYSQVARR